MVAQTSKLLDLYGAEVFTKAITETAARGTHHPGEVGVLCQSIDVPPSAPSPIDIRLGWQRPDRDVIRTTWGPTMPSDDLAIQLRQLGFRAPVASLRAFFEHPAHSRLGPRETCEKPAEMERPERENRNLAARTRQATLGKFPTMDRFDWTTHAPSTAASTKTCTPPSTSSNAARPRSCAAPAASARPPSTQNLGLAAVVRGHSVRFSSLAGLLTDLLRRESLPALERSLRHRYLLPKLLIVDELEGSEFKAGIASNLAASFRSNYAHSVTFPRIACP